LGDETFESGYVVPALVGSGSGRICLGRQCTTFTDSPAYHDHNWGIWRDVTWEWGAARGEKMSLLYGGVYGPSSRADHGTANLGAPFFLTMVDSLGVKQVLRFTRVDYQGWQRAGGMSGARSPQRFTLVASRGLDTLHLNVRVLDALGTSMGASGFRRLFLQMRGEFVTSGRVLGEIVADSGTGFFETYVH
jgi:hypothetical protein